MITTSLASRLFKAPWRWLGVLAVALTVTSCATLLGRPERGITIRRQAKVCFRQSERAHILASVAPTECYSMRCSRVTLANGTAFLDRQDFRLEFETFFKLLKTKSLLPCTPDCLGGGNLAFDLGQLEVGRYKVYLWDEYIGDLEVTSGLPWHDKCLPMVAAEE